MGELELLTKIMNKLEAVEQLEKRVSKLEERVETLTRIALNSSSNNSKDGSPDLDRAADLAILHWHEKPPIGSGK